MPKAGVGTLAGPLAKILGKPESQARTRGCFSGARSQRPLSIGERALLAPRAPRVDLTSKGEGGDPSLALCSLLTCPTVN